MVTWTILGYETDLNNAPIRKFVNLKRIIRQEHGLRRCGVAHYEQEKRYDGDPAADFLGARIGHYKAQFAQPFGASPLPHGVFHRTPIDIPILCRICSS
jgi:hypothetical protein